MIGQVAIGLAILLVAGLVSWRLRRARPEAPSRDPYPVPRQLDRDDFPNPNAPWLVAYFSSVTCGSCQGLGPKVAVLESRHVAVHEATFEGARALHERYDIAAIPMVLVADHEGVVCRAFVGSTTATDLWAALAELRDPGITPEPQLGALE
jgi:hypothetical protein